jgi:hypothetical protein
MFHLDDEIVDIVDRNRPSFSNPRNIADRVVDIIEIGTFLMIFLLDKIKIIRK